MLDLEKWRLEKQRQFMHNDAIGYVCGFYERDVKELIDRLQVAEAENARNEKLFAEMSQVNNKLIAENAELKANNTELVVCLNKMLNASLFSVG